LEFSDTSPDHQHQVDLERLMGDEIDHLKSDIERKDNEILEKNKALDALQWKLTELDEKLEEAQRDITQNQTLIAYLKDIKEGLTKQLKQGQDEMQKLKEDKQTYKNTLDFIVSTKTHVKITAVNRFIRLQKMITREQNKVYALQQTLGRHVIEYEEKMKQLMQDNRTLEQRNAQLEHSVMDYQSKLDSLQEEHNVLVSKVAEETVLHEQKVAQMDDTVDRLREHINPAEMTIEDQRMYHEAKIRDLQKRHDTKVSAMADQIERLNKENAFLAKCPKCASARTPVVSCSEVCALFTTF